MDTFIDYKFLDSLKKEVKSVRNDLLKKDKSEVLAVEFDTNKGVTRCRIITNSFSMYRNFLCDKVYRFSVAQILAYSNE